jgi:hypothetical protein
VVVRDVDVVDLEGARVHAEQCCTNSRRDSAGHAYDIQPAFTDAFMSRTRARPELSFASVQIEAAWRPAAAYYDGA